MQLLDSNERTMTKEEKLKLEVMRTIISSKGFNIRDTKLDFNFRNVSGVSRMANFLLKRFNISFKDKKEETAFWPESELNWPGKEAETTGGRLKAPKKEEEDVTVKDDDNPDVNDNSDDNKNDEKDTGKDSGKKKTTKKKSAKQGSTKKKTDK